jgi:hypothetical protein
MKISIMAMISKNNENQPAENMKRQYVNNGIESE